MKRSRNEISGISEIPEIPEISNNRFTNNKINKTKEGRYPVRSDEITQDIPDSDFHMPKTGEEEELPIKLPSELEQLIGEQRKQKKRIETDEDEFVAIFNDYPAFINFINTDVCAINNNCFCEFMKAPTGKSTSPFTLSFLYTEEKKEEKLYFDYSFFTTRAPFGYSLYTSIPQIRERSSTPFFDAMRTLLERIPRYSPSRVPDSENTVTLHKYMIIIDRLIYFYNIYLLKNQHKLNGFSNTAVFAVLFHGGYCSYDVDEAGVVNDVPPPVENVFICSKAAPSRFSYSLGSPSNPRVTFDMLTEITNDVKSRGYVNFDAAVFPYYKCSRANKDKCVANCYSELIREGNAMEHYITPNTTQYIDKQYNYDLDDKRYIIDLEQFDRLQTSGLSNEEKYLNSSITETEFIKSRFKPYYTGSKIKGYMITLKDIIDYASQVLNKQNVFIYDASCGVIIPMTTWKPSVNVHTGKKIFDSTGKQVTTIELPKAKQVEPLTKKAAQKGFGKSIKRRHRKTKKNKRRRHNKRITKRR
jgi:hypothetical protein